MDHLYSIKFELQRQIRNQNHVAITLATHLLSKEFPNSNVLFSPLSYHVVLSLLANGSNAQTLHQILAFLKTETTHDLNSLCAHIVPLIFADGSPLGGPRLSCANGLWLQKTLSLKPSFKHVVDTVFKAACNEADFKDKDKRDEIVKEVNAWAEKHTNGLIKQALPSDAVSDLTWIIIANAVYFKGAWKQKFDKSTTKEHDFHLLNGNKVQVPFMTSKRDQIVEEYADFKVLGLPYLQGQDKRQFTMYSFLPNEKDGLQSLVEKIGSKSDFLGSHFPVSKVEVGQFLIPKFKISFGFQASDMLQELGLTLPFSDAEGLSEMVDSAGQPTYVSGIFQKSFMEVNEEGTEAAVTLITTCFGAAPVRQKPKKVDFVADHPFLFVIREDVTGVVLFMGQVINPSIE